MHHHQHASRSTSVTNWTLDVSTKNKKRNKDDGKSDDTTRVKENRDTHSKHKHRRHDGGEENWSRRTSEDGSGEDIRSPKSRFNRGAAAAAGRKWSTPPLPPPPTNLWSSAASQPQLKITTSPAAVVLFAARWFFQPTFERNIVL